MAEGARHSFEQKGVVRVGSRDLQGHTLSLEAALEAALATGSKEHWTPIVVNVAPATLTITHEQVGPAPRCPVAVPVPAARRGQR